MEMFPVWFQMKRNTKFHSGGCVYRNMTSHWAKWREVTASMDETVWYALEGWNSISSFDCWTMPELSCSSQKRKKKWKGKLIIMIEAKVCTVKNIKSTNKTKGNQLERIPSHLIKNHNKLKYVGYETSQESCYNGKQRFLVLKYISRQELRLRVIALHFFEKQKTFTWWLRSLKKKKKRKVLSSRNFLPILLSSDYTDLWYKIIVTCVVWEEQKELKQRRMMKELKQRRMMKELKQRRAERGEAEKKIGRASCRERVLMSV